MSHRAPQPPPPDSGKPPMVSPPPPPKRGTDFGGERDALRIQIATLTAQLAEANARVEKLEAGLRDALTAPSLVFVGDSPLYRRLAALLADGGGDG